MHNKRKVGRPKNPAPIKAKKFKAVGLEQDVYEKLDVIRNRYAIELGFVMSFSQTIAYIARGLAKDIK